MLRCSRKINMHTHIPPTCTQGFWFKTSSLLEIPVPYFPLKILVFQTLLPLRISNDPPKQVRMDILRNHTISHLSEVHACVQTLICTSPSPMSDRLPWVKSRDDSCNSLDGDVLRCSSVVLLLL